MLVYEEIKSGFFGDVDLGIIADKIRNKYIEVANRVADNIIKNTYRTLMTRGMKGCYVYCTDKKLNKYFKMTL